MAARRAKRKTAAEAAAEQRVRDEATVVLWADTYGAPIQLLIGWNPDTGAWAPSSPVGMMLGLIQGNNFQTTAARLAGITNLPSILAKGEEYMIDLPEDRLFIPVDVRPFIDICRAVDIAESFGESALVKVVNDESKRDPKLALQFLSRRYGQRWREQQTIFTGEEVDERDRAVSEALADPNTALALAAVAHTIEDVAPKDT